MTSHNCVSFGRLSGRPHGLHSQRKAHFNSGQKDVCTAEPRGNCRDTELLCVKWVFNFLF